MVSNREEHYHFTSLFEDNITQVGSIAFNAHPGIAAFSRSFARVSSNIHSVPPNHGEQALAPLSFSTDGILIPHVRCVERF